MYNIRQSDNKHQWFVESKDQYNFWKIQKVFYSKERCEEFVKIQNIVDQVA